ncbi:hypothetical protein [Nitrosococcus wardiae]|uniref:Type I restriction endonuclease subunit R n=1 Tax=Nitrosococcus wardiae TaxID=1814290 RepID=A0A4P7BX18_9GAMM|nr:hypothetical protein [Nitrosococcus wardiae]QBQ53640.1 hypothetical protein E3U44_03300 [Nitrosococcus wardiae]
MLKRYTTYAMAFKIAQQQRLLDKEGEHAYPVFPWVQWPPDSLDIEQKAMVIIEHFRHHVAHLLSGQAKAVLITSSCQAAVRYQLAFRRYTATTNQQYRHIQTLDDHDRVILGTHKLQKGFSQPTLCALYVDKKFIGTDCVQTLSRLNRLRSSKEPPFILDFVNSPEQILNAFRPYYPSAELTLVSNPEGIYQLQSQLDKARIYTWQDVDSFAAAFFDPKQTPDRLHYYCQPAVERFRDRYQEVIKIIQATQQAEKEAAATGDRIRRENARHDFQQAREAKETLEQFKKNLVSFIRCYEFISQIVDYGDRELEKLTVYARHLHLLLKEKGGGETINLSLRALEHYRLNKISEQELNIVQQKAPNEPRNAMKTNRQRQVEKAPLITRLKPLLAGESLSDRDRLNYLHTIKDKLLENPAIAAQIENQPQEQDSILVNDFSQAVQQAVMESLKNHHEIAAQLLHNEVVAKEFGRFLLDLLLIKHE